MKKTLLFSFMLLMVSYQPNVYAVEKIRLKGPQIKNTVLTKKTTVSMKYEEGLSKIQEYIKNSDFKKAEELTREMLKLYPGNNDFQMILDKLNASKKYEEGLSKIKEYIKNSDFKSAEDLTREMLILYPGNNDFQMILDRLNASKQYDEGLSKIKDYIKNSDFKKAEDLTRQMLILYPGNTDFQMMLAQIYSWEGKYEESVLVYQEILRNKYSPEVKTELDKVIAAKEFEDLKQLQKTLGTKEYELKLKEYYESGKDPYNSGYLLGMHYIENRDYDKAQKLFSELKTKFPDDIDLKILYLESLIDNKNYTDANKFFADLKEEDRALIKTKSDDISYRLKNNYFQLKGAYYIYPPNIQNEREISLELSQQIANFTLIPHYSNISRYGLNDNQLGLDAYALFDEKRYGFVSLTVSPDAEFLPVWTAEADVFQGIGIFELSIGYTRMNFPTSGVNIIKPGIRAYLPLKLALEEQLYFVPEQLAYSLLSTLNWEPTHKFSAFYTFGFGQLAERLTSSQDLTKLSSTSHTLGLRYRFMPELSINAEFLYNHREKLYDITGASVYTKYWW